MSERVDSKLRTVVLARYQYRHEAEFAAGFLDEAGIPYRLQIDDPAMGMTIGAPATLWVRGMDVRDALEALDMRELPSHRAAAEAAALEALAEARAGAQGGDETVSSFGHDADEALPSPTGPVGAASSGALPRGRPASPDGRLGALERTLGVGLFVAAVGTTYVASFGTAWEIALVVVAAPVGLGGVLGRAPDPVRRLLRAISGSAP